MSFFLVLVAAQQDPRLDISDVYLFKGDTGSVFVMNTNPVSADKGFHPEAVYEFHLDIDGDTVQDLTFRFTFVAPAPDGRLAWSLTRRTGEDAADRNARGAFVATGTTEETVTTPDGIKIFVGRAADPFYIEGSVVTAVVTALKLGAKVDPGNFSPEPATQNAG